VQGRISQLSKEQIAEVAARLRQLELHIAQAWTADETQQLIAKWGELHRG
jgi:transposase